MDLQSCMAVFLWIIMPTATAGIRCWKCIAHDCEVDPSENNKAAKVNCQDGQSCMKVRYRMFDNYTHFDSVIRTCSSGLCDSSTMDQFQTCVKEPKKYMVSGCVLKSCCKDRDLCNSTIKLVTANNLWIMVCWIHIMMKFHIYS